MAEEDFISVEPMSIDQLAGSFVLIMGAIGSLLLVIWQSRCLCRCRIGCSDNCYIFDCAREPPKEDKEQVEDKEALKEDKKELGPVAEANLHGRPDMLRRVPLSVEEEELIPSTPRSVVGVADLPDDIHN